jgi:hypothetical protein
MAAWGRQTELEIRQQIALHQPRPERWFFVHPGIGPTGPLQLAAAANDLSYFRSSIFGLRL